MSRCKSCSVKQLSNMLCVKYPCQMSMSNIHVKCLCQNVMYGKWKVSTKPYAQKQSIEVKLGLNQSYVLCKCMQLFNMNIYAVLWKCIHPSLVTVVINPLNKLKVYLSYIIEFGHSFLSPFPGMSGTGVVNSYGTTTY